MAVRWPLVGCQRPQPSAGPACGGGRDHRARERVLVHLRLDAHVVDVDVAVRVAHHRHDLPRACPYGSVRGCVSARLSSRVRACVRASIFKAQHSTAQHSTAQHSTAQHSTARHGTARHPRAPRLAHNGLWRVRTFMPHMAAEAGFVPCAEIGMMHTSRLASPRLRWYSRMASSPAYSPVHQSVGPGVNHRSHNGRRATRRSRDGPTSDGRRGAAAALPLTTPAGPAI